MQRYLALQVGLQRHRLLLSAFVGYALTITEQITETDTTPQPQNGDGQTVGITHHTDGESVGINLESECWQVLHHMVVRQESATPYSSTSLVTSTIRSTIALNDARRNRASTASKCLNQSEFSIKTSHSHAKIAVTNVRTKILTRKACHQKQSSPS